MARQVAAQHQGTNPCFPCSLLPSPHARHHCDLAPNPLVGRGLLWPIWREGKSEWGCRRRRDRGENKSPVLGEKPLREDLLKLNLFIYLFMVESGQVLRGSQQLLPPEASPSPALPRVKMVPVLGQEHICRQVRNGRT